MSESERAMEYEEHLAKIAKVGKRSSPELCPYRLPYVYFDDALDNGVKDDTLWVRKEHFGYSIERVRDGVHFPVPTRKGLYLMIQRNLCIYLKDPAYADSPSPKNIYALHHGIAVARICKEVLFLPETDPVHHHEVETFMNDLLRFLHCKPSKDYMCDFP